MRELRLGLWHWQSPHPDWDERQWWPELPAHSEPRDRAALERVLS